MGAIELLDGIQHEVDGTLLRQPVQQQRWREEVLAEVPLTVALHAIDHLRDRDVVPVTHVVGQPTTD